MDKSEAEMLLADPGKCGTIFCWLTPTSKHCTSSPLMLKQICWEAMNAIAHTYPMLEALYLLLHYKPPTCNLSIRLSLALYQYQLMQSYMASIGLHSLVRQQEATIPIVTSARD